MVSFRGQDFKIHLEAWPKKKKTHQTDSSIHIPAPRPTHNPETRHLPPDPHTPSPDESLITHVHLDISPHQLTPPDTLTPRHPSHTPKHIHTHQDKMTPRQNRYTHTYLPHLYTRHPGFHTPITLQLLHTLFSGSNHV